MISLKNVIPREMREDLSGSSTSYWKLCRTNLATLVYNYSNNTISTHTTLNSGVYVLICCYFPHQMNNFLHLEAETI